MSLLVFGHGGARVLAFLAPGHCVPDDDGDAQ